MTAVGGETSADASLRMGLALLTAGNARGACGYLHSTLAAEPSNAQALRGLVTARLALNELPEAEEAADQLARVAPNQISTHEMRARVYLKQGAFPLSAAAAETMIKAAPNNATAFHLLAAARIGQKRYREALAATQEGRRLAPNWPALMAQSGWAKLQLNGPPAARADVEEAFRLAPKDRYVRYVAALLAMTSGQTERARELCASILRENVNDRSALDLFVLSEGPFPVHRWAVRWRYFCKSAGPFAWLVRGLGWLIVVVVLIIIGAGTAGAAWVLMIGLRFWIAAERRERTKRVVRHFTAPTVRN